MEKIKTVFAAIDAAIQRKFDAAVFFLMRHCGLSKAIIRYALWAIFILTSIVNVYCSWVKNSYKLDWSMVWNGLWIFVFFHLQRRDYRHDHSAGKKFMYSATDLRYAKMLVVGKALLWFAFFFWLQLMFAIWTMPTKDNDYIIQIRIVRDIANSIGQLAFIAMLYLVRTPPEPPPREEKLKVLVPVQQHADS